MAIIVQKEGEEVPAEIIAGAIVEISKGMQKLNNTRLTRKAIITLIAKNSRVGERTIELVLNNLEELEHTWLKPKKAGKPG